MIVSWEFTDGSGGHTDYGDPREAEALARDIAERFPYARVWIDDEIINRGFVASNERDGEQA